MSILDTPQGGGPCFEAPLRTLHLNVKNAIQFVRCEPESKQKTCRQEGVGGGGTGGLCLPPTPGVLCFIYRGGGYLEQDFVMLIGNLPRKF